MDKAHVFALLEYVKVFQPIGSDDITVRAWHLALDPDMPLMWARDRLFRHYRDSSVFLAPVDFNRWWREAKERDYWQQHGARRTAEMDQDAAEAKEDWTEIMASPRAPKYAAVMKAYVASLQTDNPWPDEDLAAKMDAIRKEKDS